MTGIIIKTPESARYPQGTVLWPDGKPVKSGDLALLEPKGGKQTSQPRELADLKVSERAFALDIDRQRYYFDLGHGMFRVGDYGQGLLSSKMEVLSPMTPAERDFAIKAVRLELKRRPDERLRRLADEAERIPSTQLQQEYDAYGRVRPADRRFSAADAALTNDLGHPPRIVPPTSSHIL